MRDALRARDGLDVSEIDLLAAAARIGIARQLVHERDLGMPPGRFAGMAQRLQAEAEVSDKQARWAVDTWAWALAVEEQGAASEDPSFIPMSLGPMARRRFRVRDRAFSLAFLAFVVATAAAVVVLTRGGPAPVAAATPPAPSLVVSPVPVGSPDVVVPFTVGRRRAVATTRLEARGLTWTIVTRPSGEATPGTVLRQRPAAGQTRAPGSTVTLVVAIEPPDVGRPRALTFDLAITSFTITWDPPAKGAAVEYYEVWIDGELAGERRADHRTFTRGGLPAGGTHLLTLISVGKNGTQTVSKTREVTLLAPPPPVEEPPVAEAPPPAPPPPPPSPTPTPEPCTAPDPAFCV